MSEIYKFFNSAPGDIREYQANDFADYFSNVLSSGLLHTDESPSLEVKCDGNDMRTYVTPGKALIQGYVYENTNDLYLEHGLPEQTLDRIDRIVLRLDKRNQSRFIRLFVVQGEVGENPVPPELQRDDYIYELAIAQIRVRANTSSLDPVDLLDERLDEEVCGLVYSLISIPTSHFLEQWNTYFNSKKSILDEDTTRFQQDVADKLVQTQTELEQFQGDLSDKLTYFETEFDAWFEGLQTTGFIESSEKGKPNGVASLDATGKVPSSQVNVDTTNLATKEELNAHLADYTSFKDDTESELDNLKSSVSDGKKDLGFHVADKGGVVKDADNDGIPTFAELEDGVTDIWQNGQKAKAEAEALMDINDNVQGHSDVFYNLFDGTSDHSPYKLDLTKTTSTEALPSGTTQLVDKVVDPRGFQTGQKVTVLDDVNKEEVELTRAEVVEEVATNEVVDATVVNEAYDTSGNGGRKSVRLENGTLITGVIDTTNKNYILYKSKDNGISFNSVHIGTSFSDIYDISLVATGNKVHIIYSYYSSNRRVAHDFYNDDDESVTFVAMVERGLSEIGNVSLAINPEGTELHATWASKTSADPNSFNIQYAKGIINEDGSVTWGSVEQVTKANSSTIYFQNPSISVKDELPHIIVESKDGGLNSYLIINITKAFDTRNIWGAYVNSPWGTSLVHAGSSYKQSSPSAIYVPPEVNGLPQGKIWVAWHGVDSGDSTYDIRASYSDDGGFTWSAMQKITNEGDTQRYPSITANGKNEIFIRFEGFTTEWMIRELMHSDSWSSISDITTGNNPSTLFDPTFTLDFTEPLFIYQDGENSKVGFYGTWDTVTHTPYLECAPLQNDYKEGTLIARSTINEDGTFGSWDDIETHTVENATVTPNAYDTSGNGGRKTTILSNGWIVAVTHDTLTTPNRYIISVDKVDGGGFNQLCYYQPSTNNPLSSPSITSIGNTVYMLFSRSYVPYSCVIDVELQTNENIYSSQSVIGEQENDIGNCSVITNAEGTELHATWSSKNSTYQNSFNIRYAKGTINADGSVTWGSVDQVTTLNATDGRTAVEPTITIDYNNIPTIIFKSDHFKWGSDGTASYGSAITGISVVKRDNTLVGSGSLDANWTGHTIYTASSGSYTQSSPSAIFVPSDINGLPNGRIWVAWHGKDSTDSSAYNIRVSYSDDGGTTWSAMEKLTDSESGLYRPSLSFDKNNSGYIVTYGTIGGTNADNYTIQSISYNTIDGWSDVTSITGQEGAMYPSTLFDTTFSIDFSEPLFIYQNNVTPKVGFYGTWTVGQEVPLTENDIRFTLSDTDEVVTWVYADDTLTVDGSVNGVSMEKSVDGEENMLEVALGDSTDAELHITVSRADTSTNGKVKKILGAVG